MSYDRTYRKTTTRNSRRPNYLPPPPPAGSNGHSVLGYWVPLVAIGTLAVGGLAAWVWSERSENDEDDYAEEKPPRPSTGIGGPYPQYTAQQQQPTGILPHQRPDQAPPPGVSEQYGGNASSYYAESSTQSRSAEQRTDATFFTRMSGAIRRTPSPQQFFDSASRQVVAAGAAAGAALSSIMEVDSNGDRHERVARDERDGFSDHERWSEEAEELQKTDNGRGKGKERAKRTVAVVLSAESHSSYTAHDDSAFHTEHGSILSHLPHQHDPNTTELFVLIYSPTLKSLPTTSYASSNLGSSYSQISTPVHTPGSDPHSLSPRLKASGTDDPHFDALYSQALALVSHPTQIMPFTTSDGYVSMLRHLAPQIVYVSDGLSGRNGETVAGLKGWVGHTVLVIGDEGHGGLADTETETEDEAIREGSKWWERSDFVGLGKEVDVVDAARIGDDWSRRVAGRE
ncbi:uncharacterized protein RCC_03810 [Ramularia collo-cygni]|uniref:Uncharacterized protein n=1 Tax=Ramularia collo-cygni TaxID=112498 RepID=A0A2D3UQG4_9PEZI|nr:uncharacterized protein RCC_03810 [Ramularia collo-cygni]CZT17971.1 uncharacterized protein RCC_03810 [Ramularia collo-cygni]